MNFLLIPRQGLLSSIGITGPIGAAFAMVISTAIGFVWIRFSAKKLSGIHLLQTHTPRHIIAGAVMGAVLYLIAYGTGLFPLIHWYYIVLFGGIGLIMYLGVLYVLREFSKKDFHFYLDLLRPIEMFRYMSSELKEGKTKK